MNREALGAMGEIVGAVVTAAILAVGCGRAVGPATDTEQATIEAMYGARLEAFQSAPTAREMAEAYVRDITEDAVWMPPSVPPIRGKAAVRSWAQEFFSSFVLQLDEQDIDPLEIGERLAVRRFTSAGAYIPREGGDPIPFDQKYVDILRRQPDGAWKLSFHMWSSNNSDATIWR